MKLHLRFLTIHVYGVYNKIVCCLKCALLTCLANTRPAGTVTRGSVRHREDPYKNACTIAQNI